MSLTVPPPTPVQARAVRAPGPLSRERLRRLPHPELFAGLALAFIGSLYFATFSPWIFLARGVEDVGIFTGGALRLLQGQVPYRDFFLFVGPLGPALTAIWFAVMGHGAVGIITLTMTLGVLLTLAIFETLRLIVSLRAAFAGALASLPLGLPLWYSISHHWFAALFLALSLVSALSAVRSRRTGWLVSAGAFCALAGFSHQARGAVSFVALLGVVPLIAPTGRRRAGYLAVLAGAVLVSLPILGYLLWRVPLSQLLFGLVGFGVSDYPKANIVPYLALDIIPPGWNVEGWASVLQVYLAYLATAVGPLSIPALGLRALYLWRRGRKDEARLRGVLSILAVGAWCGVLYQASAVHLAYAGFAWIPTSTVLLDDALRSPVARVHHAAALALAAGGVAWLVFLPVARTTEILWGGVVIAPSPTGPVPLGTGHEAADLSESFSDVSAFMLQHTTSGTPVFFYPYRSVDNALLDLSVPVPLDFIAPGENTDAQVISVIDDVAQLHAARYVVIERAAAARIVATDGPSSLGAWAVQTLRADLPLVYQTEYVEIRDGSGEATGSMPQG